MMLDRKRLHAILLTALSSIELLRLSSTSSQSPVLRLWLSLAVLSSKLMET
jgi:hypothetical protein